MEASPAAVSLVAHLIISMYAMSTFLTHLSSMPSSSSVMQAFYANQSCDPFLAQSKPCELGNYVSYAVNVSNADQVAATVTFAAKNNIRLVIRNTGHE